MLKCSNKSLRTHTHTTHRAPSGIYRKCQKHTHIVDSIASKRPNGRTTTLSIRISTITQHPTRPQPLRFPRTQLILLLTLCCISPTDADVIAHRFCRRSALKCIGKQATRTTTSKDRTIRNNTPHGVARSHSIDNQLLSRYYAFAHTHTHKHKWSHQHCGNIGLALAPIATTVLVNRRRRRRRENNRH